MLSRTRLKNLNKLIDAEGSVAAFARRYTLTPAYLWQVRNVRDGKPIRSVGERFAREFERKAGLPAYWLDKDHDEGTVREVAGASFAQQLYNEARERDVPDQMQQTILYMLKSTPKKQP